MPASLDPQLALDERAINHPDLEAALERRLRARDDVTEVRGVYKKAHEEVKNLVAGLGEFEPETALRVGRFRITKKVIEARHVEFDSAEREQISIGLIDADGEPVKRSGGRPKLHSVSDDEDLRPTGEVNADALRGEADRSSS